MKMKFNEEQQMLIESTKRFLEKNVPIEKVKAMLQEANEQDVQLWDKIAALGWQSIIIPERYGGSNGTLMDLAIIYEQCGRVLFPTTFYSNTFAILTYLQLATESQKQKYLSSFAEGKLLATVAFEEREALNNPEFFQTEITSTQSGLVLSGEKCFVQNVQSVDQILVYAKYRDGFSVAVVRGDHPNLTITPHVTIGQSPQYRVKFDEVLVEELIGEQRVTSKDLLAVRMKMTALQTVEMAGGSQKVIEDTVAYVSMRKQFGVPIGTFQAVQHHLANMYTQSEASRLAAYKAISYLDGELDATREIHIAKSYVSKAYKDITIMAHQLWGGMGYSIESNLFLWSNRAKVTELSFGTETFHRSQLRKQLKEKLLQSQLV